MGVSIVSGVAADSIPSLPPPEFADLGMSAIFAIDEFYGDLADLRKCTPEHVAAIDAFIARNENPMAYLVEQRKDLIAQARAKGLSEDAIKDVLQREINLWHIPYEGRVLFPAIRKRLVICGGFSDRERAVWPAFCAPAQNIHSKSKPSKSWLRTTEAILEPLDKNERIVFTCKLLVEYPVHRSYYGTPIDHVIRGMI
jgi:hypothetical protein